MFLSALSTGIRFKEQETRKEISSMLTHLHGRQILNWNNFQMWTSFFESFTYSNDEQLLFTLSN